MASSFVRAQVPVGDKGQVKCPRHSRKDVLFSCLDCQEELVCTDCVKSYHQGHSFLKLSEVIEEKKNNIKAFIETSEIVTLPSIQSEISTIEEKTKDSSKRLSKTLNDITKRAEYLKTKIEEVMKSLFVTCKTLEMENEELLEHYKAKLRTMDLDLQTTVKDCKCVLSSSNIANIFDVERDLHSIVQRPKHPDIQLANFDDGCCVDITGGFGSLSTRVVKYLTDDGTTKRNEGIITFYF